MHVWAAAIGYQAVGGMVSASPCAELICDMIFSNERSVEYAFCRSSVSAKIQGTSSYGTPVG